MAKRRITYEDGTSVLEDIPNSDMIPGLEKLNNTLPKPAKAPIPKLLDPSQKNNWAVQINTLANKMTMTPLIKAGLGLETAFAPKASGDSRLKGIADAITGGGQILALGAGGSAIPNTLKGAAKLGLGITGASLGAPAGKDVARRMGGGPGVQAMGEVGGGLVGGGLGYKIPDIPLQDALALRGGVLGALKRLALGSSQETATKPAKGSVAPAKAVPAATKPITEAPLSGNTNSLKPAGTGPPPAPFNPNQPVAQGTTIAPMNPMEVLMRAQQAKNVSPATGVPGPQSFEPPLALPGARTAFGGPLPEIQAGPDQKSLATLESALKMNKSLGEASKKAAPAPAAAKPPKTRTSSERKEVKDDEEARSMKQVANKYFNKK